MEHFKNAYYLCNNQLLDKLKLDMKMNQINPIERAVNWNKARNNNDFSIRREVKMLAEELFEMCAYDRDEAKKLSEVFVKAHIDSRSSYTQNIQDVVDAAGDMIFIASGTIYKAKFDPMKVLSIICDANDKKGSSVDADGKIVKGIDFIEPILNEAQDAVL